MSFGYAAYILLQAAAVYSGIVPSQKITPPGYTQALIESSRPNIVSSGIDDGSGHIKEVRIKKRTRVAQGETATDDNCDIDARPAYTEDTIAPTLFRKYAIFLDDNTIAHYEKEASQRVKSVNGIPTLTGVTPLLQEQWQLILEAANALYGDIDNDLLTAQSTNFGKNKTTGLTTAKNCNFPLTINGALNTGMNMVMNDAAENEFNLMNLFVVGSGLINNYYDKQRSKGIDSAGVNTSSEFLPTYYYDPYTASKWGANKFGIFERNAVQLIDINRFVGFKAGIKGSSFFGNIPLPVTVSNGTTISMNFDIQLKYQDCPGEYPVAGYDELQSIDRGWILIISKSFDQYGIGSDYYSSGDRLTGNKGSLFYTAQNI